MTEPLVLDTWAIVPEIARKIEQAGKGYAQMQHLFEFGPKIEVKEEEKKGSSEDDEDGEEGEHHDFERKKPKKSKD